MKKNKKNEKDINLLRKEVENINIVGGVYSYNNNYQNSDCPVIHEVHIEKTEK